MLDHRLNNPDEAMSDVAQWWCWWWWWVLSRCLGSEVNPEPGEAKQRPFPSCVECRLLTLLSSFAQNVDMKCGVAEMIGAGDRIEKSPVRTPMAAYTVL
ncbi:hypothetical protein O3P69_016048 [Scylla paramamosain]|uniref:Uncharacterized protein n=1 Tax=Scylla paramamosain TaxID=85552 RepID=A0AAW0TAR1_SCYPA